MDPQLRKLLEVSYEAWIDSGINHMAMRGSNKVRRSSQAALMLSHQRHQCDACLTPDFHMFTLTG